MKQTFATHEHSSSLRCVATEGKFLASGGADDKICVYDMIQRKEHVMLTHHNSTVNCLEFTPKNTHLISSSTDGVLAITRVGNWVLEKQWSKAHKNGYPIAIAVHPTGKLLFTLGSDCSLNTWNLIKGRTAYIMNLNSKCTDAKSISFIKVSPDGEKFILGGGMNIEIWDIGIGGISCSFNYKIKIACAIWLSDNVIAIGYENGTLRVLNIETNDTNTYEVYDNRVKCIEFLNNYLVTASSSGCIKVWSYKKNVLTEICYCNTGCRITCITLVDALKVKKEEKPVEETSMIEETVKVNQFPTTLKRKLIVLEDSDDEVSNKVQMKVGQKKSKKNKKKQVEVEKNDHITLKEKRKTQKNKNNDKIVEVLNISKNKSKKVKLNHKSIKNKQHDSWNVEDVK